MTKEQYLRILLISGRDWFNWHDVEYRVHEFENWRQQGLIEQNAEPKNWKLTDLAREVHGVKND